MTRITEILVEMRNRQFSLKCCIIFFSMATKLNQTAPTSSEKGLKSLLFIIRSCVPK